MEQIGVGPLSGTTDPTPQLVELSESEQIGPIGDQCVHGRHIDARLDDGRADEDVVVALPEINHDPFERALIHLPVSDRHPRLGYEVPEPFGDMVDVATQLCTKKTCPSRSSSRRIASATARSSYSPT